jgi:hypothetical protein
LNLLFCRHENDVQQQHDTQKEDPFGFLTSGMRAQAQSVSFGC